MAYSGRPNIRPGLPSNPAPRSRSVSALGHASNTPSQSRSSSVERGRREPLPRAMMPNTPIPRQQRHEAIPRPSSSFGTQEPSREHIPFRLLERRSLLPADSQETPNQNRIDVPPRPASDAPLERHSRSSSVAASDRRASRPLPPIPHTLRPQRSLAPRKFTRPPVPPLPDLRHLNGLSDRENALETRKSEESISSLTSSSSQSSFASRASLFSPQPTSSSASSLSSYYDDDDEQPPKGKEETQRRAQAADGFGLSLWNRVAEAAGNLTVSVSKAIETNIATYAGEGDDSGGSRFSAHSRHEELPPLHSKARTPADLPDWLFEERDRGALGRLRIANATVEDEATSSRATPVGIIIKDSAPSTLSREASRVRFAEQVHPRVLRKSQSTIIRGASQKAALPSALDPRAMVRTTAIPPVPRVNAALVDADLRGRRPATHGLPSSVRPSRTHVSVL
ncbi:hypothetical protein EIP91_006505 [Steccherinum ochraceum]|uniref:Uncharacterized protein n=1 Tax=Steccherinum ochraceum TaxID=92696 RepID=A0A4R0RZ61_9APHY|nr:hypothetical protein EIP91_006505 [Steccherinum ochraceum]